MNADAFSKQVKRMPLWIIFVPISPIAAMLYSMHKWRKMKLGWINRHSALSGLCMVTVTTILSFVFCTPLLYLAEKSGSVLIQFIALYLCWVYISIIIREIDYRTRKRYFEKQDSRK